MKRKHDPCAFTGRSVRAARVKRRRAKTIHLALVLVGVFAFTLIALFYEGFFSLPILANILEQPEEDAIMGTLEPSATQSRQAILSIPSRDVTPTPAVSPTPKLTPTPDMTPSPTLTPSPTPFVHPGERDDAFTAGDVKLDDMSYQSDTLSINIEVREVGDSVAYIAEVYMKDLSHFIPVFANGRFDNGYQSTSDMAKDHDAILAINSDSATAADYGIIVRNGEVFRDNPPGADHLAVMDDGLLAVYPPRYINAHELMQDGAIHTFCFGPMLLNEKGEVNTYGFSVSHIKGAHPRTAFGMVEPYHYFFVVVDGRAGDYSKGMTLDEIGWLMKDLGCTVAYNLDGGGSSTMVFMGDLINRPEGERDERNIDSGIIIK